MIREMMTAVRHAVENRMSLTEFDSMLDMMSSGGQPSYTGKMVEPKNAMAIAAVWACVTILADDFAALPLLPRRWTVPGVSSEPARDHYLWPLFTEEANPRMSSFEFKQAMETWRNLWGNCFAEMEMNGRGQVVALWPWRPDRVKVVLENPSDPRSRVWYAYYPLNGGKPITVPADVMFHVRNISLDGVVGLSPIEVHRQTLGISMAQTEHKGRFFGNGMIVKGVLEHPGRLGTKALASLRESMSEYTGLSNAHRLLILEEGAKYKDIGMKMEDAQFLQSEKYTAEDAARIYKMPGHKIGLLDRATNNNVEQLSIDYTVTTQFPIVTNWSGRIHCSMLSARDRRVIFMEPDFNKLMMADHTARAKYYDSLKYVFSPDEIRQREGYNPLPDGLGKLPRVPLNTVPIDSDLAAFPQPMEQNAEPAASEDTQSPSQPAPPKNKKPKKKKVSDNAQQE